MALPAAFPTLPGQGWSAHKKPTFSTRVAAHASGREVRDALYADTLYEFEVLFNGLDSASQYPGLATQSLQTLMGFFLSMQGQFGTFLYTDPTDNAVSGQAIGTGDGTSTSFTLLRSIGTYAEPLSYVTGTPAIYLNGARQASGYTVTAPNLLSFASAPGGGVAITADLTYAFQCRFLDDQVDFENVMSNLWKVGSLKFRSVKP